MTAWDKLFDAAALAFSVSAETAKAHAEAISAAVMRTPKPTGFSALLLALSLLASDSADDATDAVTQATDAELLRAYNRYWGAGAVAEPWQAPPKAPESFASAVSGALRLGYTLPDDAAAYELTALRQPGRPLLFALSLVSDEGATVFLYGPAELRTDPLIANGDALINAIKAGMMARSIAHDHLAPIGALFNDAAWELAQPADAGVPPP